MITLLALTQLGILFTLIFLASIGIPGSLIWMISAGALAGSISDLSTIIIVVATAAILGDIAAYEIARKFSQPISKRLSKFEFFTKNEKRVRESFKKSEFPFVFFTRFIFTGLCAIVSYISGFEKLDRRKFIMAVVLGELIYAIIYPTIGYIFKETWTDIYAVIGDIITVAMFVVITVVIIQIWRSRAKLQPK